MRAQTYPISDKQYKTDKINFVLLASGPNLVRGGKMNRRRKIIDWEQPKKEASPFPPESNVAEHSENTEPTDAIKPEDSVKSTPSSYAERYITTYTPFAKGGQSQEYGRCEWFPEINPTKTHHEIDEWRRTTLNNEKIHSQKMKKQDLEKGRLRRNI